MAPRRNRKTTAFIKIVRSPTAASMLRTRKLPPFFKIAIVVICGYMIWNLNHPDDAEILHQNKKRGVQLQQLTKIPQQNIPNPGVGLDPSHLTAGTNPIASGPQLGAPGIAPGSPLVGTSMSSLPPQGNPATSEKKQQILESLKRIRFRQQMMQQLQRELFKSQPDPNAAVAAPAVASPVGQQSLPISIQMAQDRLKNAQMAMQASPIAQQGLVMPQPVAAQGSFAMPLGPSTGMDVQSLAAQQAQSAAQSAVAAGAAISAEAPPAADAAAPDFMSMSLEDLMNMKKPDFGVMTPAPAAPAPHVDATSIYGRMGDTVPFRSPEPDVKFDEQFGKLLTDYFPDCTAMGKAHNVAFLKTHKTGSSTMSNIMLRYADRHNLTVGLPLEGKWELGGYPAYIDKRLIDPNLPSYNILGHHFRYNTAKLNEFMDPNTKYVTIIRSPVDNVESVFGFFQDQEPFIHWMAEIETTQRLGTFYADPHRFFNKDTDWYMRSKNYMFFDIGYDVNNDDDAFIDQKIEEMTKNFAFVLLTDYFDESLILMKTILCWDWDDVVYVKFKMRTEEAKATINPTLAEQIKSWNRADFKLYDHFNATFWQTVDRFGKDRMEAELEEFRVRQKDAEHECIQAYEPFKKKPWILGAKLRPRPSVKCKQLAWSETVYGEHLREKMYKDILGLDKPTLEQKAALTTLFSEVSEGAFRSV